jgi:uncharacterized protein
MSGYIGAMWLLSVAHAAPLSVSDVPNPRPAGGWVADAADVLPPDAEARINARLDALQQQTSAELAVVTVPDTQGEPKEFATELLNTWGVGSREANNGVLMLLVVDRRRVEIEVGYGLEAVLTDGATGALLDQHVIPRFKAGDLAGGLEDGVAAIDTRLRAKPEETREGTGGAVDVPGFAPEEATDTGTNLALLGGGGAGGIVLGVAGWVWWQRRRRQCPVCRKEMALLDEEADDAHLDAGQQAEERLKSVDYEVRRCAEHDQVVIIEHGKWFSGYARCSRCRHRTATHRSVTLVHATYDHGGEVQVTEDCTHCHHHDVTHRHTPRKQRSSSSGGSFGGGGRSGGGGGGSFGGGRSGGGGAGRSW